MFIEVSAAIEALNRVQGLLILGVASTNHIEVATVKNADRMEVTRLSELSDLGPLVLGNFVHLTLLGRLIGVLRADGEEEVLCAILESLMQVGQLVSGAPVAHRGPPLCLIGLLVDNKAVISDNCADFIFFLLTANAENLVVDLDADEVLGEDLGVAEGDGRCGL